MAAVPTEDVSLPTEAAETEGALAGIAHSPQLDVLGLSPSDAESLIQQGLRKAFPDEPNGGQSTSGGSCTPTNDMLPPGTNAAQSNAAQFKVLFRSCVRLFVTNPTEDGWVVSGDGVMAVISHKSDPTTVSLFMVDCDGRPGFCVKYNSLLNHKTEPGDSTFHYIRLQGKYAGLSFFDEADSAQFGNILYFCEHLPPSPTGPLSALHGVLSSSPTHGATSPASPMSPRRRIVSAISPRPAPPEPPKAGQSGGSRRSGSPLASPGSSPPRAAGGRRNTIACGPGSAAAARARLQKRASAPGLRLEVHAVESDAPPLPPPPQQNVAAALLAHSEPRPKSHRSGSLKRLPPMPPPPAVSASGTTGRGRPRQGSLVVRRPPPLTPPHGPVSATNLSPLSRQGRQQSEPDFLSPPPSTTPPRQKQRTPWQDSDSGCDLPDTQRLRERSFSLSHPQ